jgi:hypothetical protein
LCEGFEFIFSPQGFGSRGGSCVGKQCRRAHCGFPSSLGVQVLIQWYHSQFQVGQWHLFSVLDKSFV